MVLSQQEATPKHVCQVSHVKNQFENESVQNLEKSSQPGWKSARLEFTGSGWPGTGNPAQTTLGPSLAGILAQLAWDTGLADLSSALPSSSSYCFALLIICCVKCFLASPLYYEDDGAAQTTCRDTGNCSQGQLHRPGRDQMSAWPTYAGAVLSSSPPCLAL